MADWQMGQVPTTGPVVAGAGTGAVDTAGASGGDGADEPRNEWSGRITSISVLHWGHRKVFPSIRSGRRSLAPQEQVCIAAIPANLAPGGALAGPAADTLAGPPQSQFCTAWGERVSRRFVSLCSADRAG